MPAIVTCGMADTGKMAAQAPLGRLEWAQLYAKRLEEGGHAVVTAWIPKVGHSLSPDAAKLTEVGFAVATGGKGATGKEAEALNAALRKATAAK